MFAERLSLPCAIRNFPALLMMAFVLPLLAGCGYNTIPTAEENARAANPSSIALMARSE